MKKTRHIFTFVAAAMLAGCTAADAGRLPMPDGCGLLRLGYAAVGEFAPLEPGDGTAGQPLPSPAEFSLTITDGGEFSRRWETLADFEAEGDFYLPAGEYTAAIAYGNPDEEGFARPAYAGEQTFTVRAREVTAAEITASPANAKVSVIATERFRTYFHDIALRLTTSSGGSFDIVLPGNAGDPAPDDTSAAVFVRAATTFSLTGSACKQPATGDAEPVRVDLPAQEEIPAAAGKHYIYKFDAKGTGGARLTITLDDTVETVEIDNELNDGARPDQE